MSEDQETFVFEFLERIHHHCNELLKAQFCSHDDYEIKRTLKRCGVLEEHLSSTMRVIHAFYSCIGLQKTIQQDYPELQWALVAVPKIGTPCLTYSADIRRTLPCHQDRVWKHQYTQAERISHMLQSHAELAKLVHLSQGIQEIPRTHYFSEHNTTNLIGKLMLEREKSLFSLNRSRYPSPHYGRALFEANYRLTIFGKPTEPSLPEMAQEEKLSIISVDSPVGGYLIETDEQSS